jgi:hypothetical protein
MTFLSRFGAGSGFRSSIIGLCTEECYSPYYLRARPLPPEDSYSACLRTDAPPAIGISEDYQAAHLHAHLFQWYVLHPAVERQPLFDEYLYEFPAAPTGPDAGKKHTQAPVSCRPKAPPFADVVSAKALNALYFDLRSLRAWGAPGKRIVLDRDVLERINVTTFKCNGHAGILKHGARPDWPTQLRQPAYGPERETIDRLLPEAVAQAVKRRPQAPRLRELSEALATMHKILGTRAADVPPDQYVEAKRFLNDLDAAVQVLQQPDACYLLTNRYAAKGGTVPELVRHMDRYSLKFAPATPGDETAYVDLYRALAACDAVARGQAIAAQR